MVFHESMLLEGREREKGSEKEREGRRRRRKAVIVCLAEVCIPKNRLGPFNTSAAPVTHSIVAAKIQILRVIGRKSIASLYYSKGVNSNLI